MSITESQEMSYKPHDVDELGVTQLARPWSTEVFGFLLYGLDYRHLDLVQVDEVRLDGWAL